MTRFPPTAAPGWALFLDVDGTLLDYASRPDAVHVPPALRHTLSALLSALDGALALVSGRSIDDLDRIFAPLRLPAAGQHGAEGRRDGDARVFAPASSALAQILAPIRAFAAERPGIRIEHKGLSAAIHYRGAEEERAALGAVVAAAVAQGGEAYKLLDSYLVFDIMPRAADKGRAVDWFMAEPPFAGRVPVFAGDDRTDEDGFAEVLARGGYAIKIGRNGDTIAPWRIATPQAFRQWLDQSVTALEACS